MITVDPTTVTSAAGAKALCRALDLATAEQLEELSDSFAGTNNRATAAELTALAAWKAGHAEAGDEPAPAGIIDWYVVDPGDPEALHYLMRPWHIVRIVMDNEARMGRFFQAVAERTEDAGLRGVALAVAARQEAHLAWLRDRLAALPEPEDGWDEDEDPPFFDQ